MVRLLIAILGAMCEVCRVDGSLLAPHHVYLDAKVNVYCEDISSWKMYI